MTAPSNPLSEAERVAMREAAGKGTGGNWRAHITSRRKPEIYTDAPPAATPNELLAGTVLRKTDAAHIAASSPSAVLRLLAERDELAGRVEAAGAALANLPKMPKAYAWTGAGSDMFDNELRHANGSKPIDYLRGWLAIFRQFGYATKDESWGELEKLISIVMRNYGELANGAANARAALNPQETDHG